MNKKANIKLAVILLVAAIISWAMLRLPEIAPFVAGAREGLLLIFTTGIIQIVTVYYFLTSLRTFKRDLKVAFYLVAAGLFIFSLVQLVPALSLFITISNIVLLNSLYVAPYILGGFLLYLGMRRFAKLLEVHDTLTAFPVVVGISLVLVCIAVLVPHPPIAGVSERLIDMIMGSIAWCGSFGVATALLALRIRRAISPIYKSAVLWFALGVMALAFTAFHELVIKLYLEASRYVGNISLWPFLLTSLLFLKAGLAFKDAGRQFIHLPANASPIDVVITMAQLVSKPGAIDPELDKIRAITAQGVSGQLSAAQRSTVRSVYLAVENYLLTKEPLHTFTREELRADLPEDFLKSLK